MKAIITFRLMKHPCILMLAAVLGNQSALAADRHVTVYFDENGCPELKQAVYEPTVRSNGNDKVVWHAAYRDSNNPVTTGYAIYFDPFRDGKPLVDRDKDGKIESTPVDSDTPAVEFKYTVVGEPDSCKDKPLDPVLRVQK